MPLRRHDARHTARRMAAATAVYALVHSVLASRVAKELTARTFGRRRRDALYRPFYLVQSVVGFGVLLGYYRGLPGRTLWHVRGPPAVLLRLAQAGGLIWAVRAATAVGLPGILGLRGLASFLKADPVAPGPEAQGPAPSDDGVDMRVVGPFRWQRHPLNFAPLPVLWLFPRMTDRLIGLALASSAYFVAGSWHEERRLRAAYGDAYERYRDRGIPFYVPRRPAAALPGTPPPALLVTT